MYISIGKASNLLGLSVSTLRRYDDDGILPSSFTTPGGHRRYELALILEMSTSIPVSTSSDHVLGYARVSGHKQKQELQTQIRCIQRHAQQHGHNLKKIYFDIASGINDQRRNFIKMLRSIPLHRPKAVIITYADRLSRFGHNVIKLYCEVFNCKLIIIFADQAKQDTQADLVEGVIEVITSYAGRLHRQRRGTFY